MKNMILLIMSGFAGVLLCIMVLAFSGKLYRGEETNGALPNTMEKSVEWAGNRSEACSGQEMLASCVEGLAVPMDSDSGLTLQVMKADGQKGVLSIRLQESFTHPNGGEDTARGERTVLLDRCVRQTPIEYKVRFYRSREELESGTAAYKTCTVEEGSCIVLPAGPQGEATFVEWRDINDYIADFTVPVTEDRAYYAVWR